MSAGRKPLTQWERQQREQFKKKLQEYSIEALETVYKLSRNSLDSRVRLQAATWIAEKAMGKSYVAFDTEENLSAGNTTIRLIVQGNEYVPSEEQEQEIIDAENNFLGNMEDEQDWDVNEEDEDWGSEVYDP